MGKSRSNTFRKALHHLKSNQIDERLQLLSEIPTNNTYGIYVVEPERTEITGENIDAPLDLTQDDPALNGRDTTGLFGEDGSILTIEPPGDTSYILGPMMSMWYSWGNFSTIGYVRQSDRRMVDLGRITGTISNWDGSSNFTSYGQLSLEQAQWYRDQYNEGNTQQYRAYYPGPPSNPADQFGRYLGDIIDKAKELAREVISRIPPVLGPWDPNILPGSANPNDKKKSEWDKYLESLPPEVRDDLLKGGNTTSPLGDLAILGLTAAAVKGALAAGIGTLLKGVSVVSIGSQVKPLFGDANNASDYNKQLGGKLVSSILSGQPQEIKLSNSAKADQINSVNPQQFRDALTFGPAPKPSAKTTINPGNKRPVFTGDWGVQGGSEVHYDSKTDTLTFTSEKTLRTTSGGNTVTRDPSGKITNFSDIPSPPQEKVNDITRELLGNGIVDNLLGGLGNIMTPVTGGQNAWNQIKNDPTMLNNFVNNLSTAANNIATGGVQGTASNTVALRVALTKIGVPQSEVEKIGGGYGQVYSQTSYSGNEIPSELRNVINSRLPRSGGGFNVVGEEKKTKSILKNIKKPYVLPEQPKVKYKIKPKANRTINVDLMKKAEVPSSFMKPEDRLWGKYEKNKNTRLSQERKNEVLDHLGGSDHYWEFMTETSRQKSNDIMYSNFEGKEKKAKIVRKEELKGDTLLFIADENGKKESILQSELSIRLANEFNKELFEKYFEEQETIEADKDPLFKKVSKHLKKEIDYSDKPAKKGYPNEPPPKMVNGWHPEYGKDKGYYNKLDPQSAEAMPETGNNEIDAKVEKAKLKKIKIKEQKKYDWRRNVSEDKKDYLRGKNIQEGMTSSGTFFTTLPSTGDVDLSSIDVTNQSSFSDIGNVDFGSDSFFSQYGEIENALTFSSYKTTPYAFINPLDTTTIDTISFTGVAGDFSNGSLPTNSDLFIGWYNYDTDEYGEFLAIPKTATNLSTYNITLPPEAKGNNVEFFFIQSRSSQNAGQDLIGYSFPVGDEFVEITNDNDGLIASLLINYDATDTADTINWGRLIASNISRNTTNIGGVLYPDSFYPGYDGPVSGNVGDPNIDGFNGDLSLLKNQSGAFVLGYLTHDTTIQDIEDRFVGTDLNTSQFFSNLQSARYYGNLYYTYNSSYNQYYSSDPTLANYYLGLANEASSNQTTYLNQMEAQLDAASALPDSRWTDEDYIKVATDIYNQYKGASSYAITNFSTKRRTPQNVFVSLDSPEASSFIRTDPIMANLSPQERLQKLKEMLEASDEYVMKALGLDFPGTGAVPPGEYDPFKQAPPGEAGDTPGVQTVDYQGNSINPNIASRVVRSATDQIRFSGTHMYQGNPGGRSPGLSNYWSPDPATAGTYSNPGAGKGVPGARPNPTGTLTSAPRPANTPRVTRSPLGQPQFKFPAGSPPPAKMITQMADDAAVSAAKKAAATTASKTIGRVVPILSIGVAAADAGVRVSKGDYGGAILSGLSAIPGPIGWAALGAQIATDAAGVTGVREQQEFDNYGDYLKDAGKIVKKNKIKLDRNAMLDLFLRELSKDSKLSDKDKEFLVAIFTDAEGLEKDDVISFIKTIQKKLMNGKSIEEQLISEKRKLKSPEEVLNKIPGYYDGKPSPLGFPVEPPPKMVNGMHPDLVDGKKVADRFNRLDPESAKATPPTGNPHIDKKVKAAAKKPK